MKTLLNIRHGQKEGDNISAKQLDQIRTFGIPGVNNLVKDQRIFLHQGTGLDRTRQTIAAYEQYLGTMQGNHTIAGYLPADTRLGSQEMFDKFMANPEIVAESKQTNWFTAYEKFDPTFIVEAQAEMFAAVRNIFANAEDNSVIISVGHTPLIEWLIFWLDKHETISRDLKLNELTGFVFTEDFRQIRITGTVGF